jgi:hypothetical protein
MQVKVQTHLYVFGHAKSPRGNGNWAFNIRGEVITLVGMYSKAKKSACQIADEFGVNSIKLLP